MSGRIHDFTQEGHSRGLPEIGRLSVGEIAEGANHPRALDYFRVYGAKPDAEKAFVDEYGKTDTILVSFFESDPARVCKQEFQLRVGKVRFAWGDGRQFWYWDSKARNNKMVVVSSREEQEATMENILKMAQADAAKMGARVKPWHQSLTLRLWLPEVRVPGEWVFSTKGESTSIQNITRAFDTILGSVGTVQGFPFELSVKIHKADNMTRSQYPIVTLRPLLSNESLEAMAKHKKNIFSNVFNSSLFVLSDKDVANAMKQLNEGDKVVLVNEPRVEIPDPNPGVEAMASSEDWKVEESTQEEGPGFNDALTKNPKDMTVADGIKYLKASKDLAEVNHRYGQLSHLHQHRGVFVAMACQSVIHAETHKQFVLLVRKYSGLREEDKFFNAVTGTRAKKGWKRADDNRAMTDR